MLKSRLTFFRWLVFGLIGLVAVWTIGGNLLASLLEKEIDRELEQKAKELAQEYPDPEPNDSALKLIAILSSEFGINVGGGTNQGIYEFGDYIGYHPDFQSSNKEFQEIREQLRQYIDSQISKPNDEIDPAPPELQRYLESKSEALRQVQSHVLNSKNLKQETVIYGLLEGDPSIVLPSKLNLANFQNILALYILEKQRLGKNKEAEEMLEVSWKINQLSQNDSSLIDQLVGLILRRIQTGVIRKVDNLSPEWQKRLLEHDYRLSMKQFIEGEYLGRYNAIQNFNRHNRYSTILDETEVDADRVTTLLKPIAHIPLSGPYFRFSAIDIYYTSRKSLEKLPTQNICLPPEPKLFPNPAWWNLWGQTFIGSSISDLRAAEQMLDLEFTQKILQVKELAKKQGKWPESVPDLESQFCPGYQYIYQVSEDGTMTIALEPEPEWAKDKGFLLTYSDRTPPQSKN